MAKPVDDVKQLDEMLKRYHEALKQYGNHKSHCAIRPCTCGWDKVRIRLEIGLKKEGRPKMNYSHDPYDQIDKEVHSRHCKKKKSRITMYDHTGYTVARCACGIKYVHDSGALRVEVILE